MTRRSLLSALCLLGGPVLIALGWWDYWNPNQINHWLAGERIFPFYWRRLALAVAVTLPVALLAWRLSLAARAALGGVSSLADRRQRTAWGFAAAIAIPFILLLKYRVTWLGVNFGSSVWTYGFVLVLSVIIVWLVSPSLRNRRLLEWLDHQGPTIILVGILFFAVVLGGLSVLRHTSFRSQALDLGTIDQAVWNTSKGRLLEYTPLPVSFGNGAPDLSATSRLVDDQLELILLPLSLLYWLWSDPRLLISLQAVLLASGAIPLYHLARAQLGENAASMAITLAYLLYLPLHHVALTAFNTSALMVPFILWAWQAAEQERWSAFYLAFGIALLCRVDAALALMGTGVYLVLKGPGNLQSRGHRRHGAAALFLGLAWLTLDFGLVSPWARAVYGLESDELLSGQVWGFLFDREIFQTLVDLTGTLGWVPLLAPLVLLPGLPVLVFDFLTAKSYHQPNLVPHLAPLMPFLFIASVRGAINAGRWVSRLLTRGEQPGLSHTGGSRLTTFFALTTTLLAAVFLSPLPPGLGFRLTHYYRVSEHERAIARTLDLVPAGAVVSAQANLFPHLSRRPVIYLFPTIADAEYVAIDLNDNADKNPIDETRFAQTVDALLADPTFHVVAFDDGALLLKRGRGRAPPAFDETLANYRAGLYRSAIVEYRGPTRLLADNLYQTEVILENRGTQGWETVGLYPIHLSYHWWTADGELVARDGLRTSLNQSVKPSDTLAQQVRFVTPAEPGDYVLEWDLVHENRAWFGERGGLTLRVEVTVE